MECVVQGILESKHVEALEVLLRGLCEGQRKTVKIHEICLKSALASELHLLCDLSEKTPTWTAKLVGGALRGAGADQLSALVRNVCESAISSNALRFFYAVGYKMDYELLRTGFCFKFQRVAPITVTVSSVCKIPKLHAIDEATPVSPGLSLVEVTAPASTDNYSEVVAAISTFTEFLAPLLYLSRPGVFAGIVPTAATAAASLVSRDSKLFLLSYLSKRSRLVILQGSLFDGPSSFFPWEEKMRRALQQGKVWDIGAGHTGP